MSTKLELFNKSQLKSKTPDIRPGDTIRVHQKIKEAVKKGKSSDKQESKIRIQIFEGLVLAKKHGKGVSATITVRKVVSGIGVEKVFPIHSPAIEKIEIAKRSRVKRAKLYYLRKAKGERAKLKNKEFAEAAAEKPEKENAHSNSAETKPKEENNDLNK